MVKLTVDLIARRTTAYQRKKREETVEHYLRRLTHLYLEDKGIDEIDDLSALRNLTVLYLYDNALTRIPNLCHNYNLTHLYLQNNKLAKMEYLTGLGRLTKLYIGHNCIAVVEGLEKLTLLQELHIENQDLPLGEKLLFDPRSINAVSGSLTVLNVSGNGLTSLRDLESLRGLTQLYTTNNRLSDIKELVKYLMSWRRLSRLDIANNPVCRKSKFRDRIITVASSLEIFDGKEVTETARQFLQNWDASKRASKETLASRQASRLPLTADHYERMSMQMQSAPLHHTHTGGGGQNYIVPAMRPPQFHKLLSRSTSQTTAPRLAPSGTIGSDLPRYLNSYGTLYHEAG